ncbi:MAG TPA: 3-methyl-2-oxobutanoate hydroxymethyltransferase [Bacillota bacterium]|nr:3-methyl-2-oxobutanoate hydroxymethyltransferase [Bacillota bacterium]
MTKIKLDKMINENEKITMITAYDYPSAKISEEAGIDMILVGDSLGMVMLGYDSTVQVTINDMIHHAKAVRRGAKETFMVVDMPFMSYQISLEDALFNAKRIFQETNADALKLEGATSENIELITRLTQAGIPVVAHIGLTPQTVHVLGGYKVQGKDKETGKKLLNEAKQLAECGVMAIVLECVPKELANIITNSISAPTIGIGAGVDCNGQVLVYHDIMQYGVDRLAKFVKPHADFNTAGTQAIKAYIDDVKSAVFPLEEHSFTIKSHDLLPEWE